MMGIVIYLFSFLRVIKKEVSYNILRCYSCCLLLLRTLRETIALRKTFLQQKGMRSLADFCRLMRRTFLQKKGMQSLADFCRLYAKNVKTTQPKTPFENDSLTENSAKNMRNKASKNIENPSQFETQN